MNIHWLGERTCHNPEIVGGKAAQLSRLAVILNNASNPRVPPGFCLEAIPAQQFDLQAAECAQINAAYHYLSERCGQADLPVAVRSSAVDEDGQNTSFAGQHESYLNVRGADAVVDAVRRCRASAQAERALHYRRSLGLEPQARLAVLVQQLVLADVSSVVFSADPCRGARDRILINATWGLGESLVGGEVTPDLYVVQKDTLSIRHRQIADKAWMTVAAAAATAAHETQQVPVPRLLRQEPCLSDEQIIALARLARLLEAIQGWAVDLECAFQDERLYLLQCRPITTLGTATLSTAATQGTAVTLGTAVPGVAIPSAAAMRAMPLHPAALGTTPHPVEVNA